MKQVCACVSSKGGPKKRTRHGGSVSIYVQLHLKARAKMTTTKKKKMREIIIAYL